MIFSILFKNLKIIFRSPFTIILLILSPILLMFIVGYTYSGDGLTGTNIGMIKSDPETFKDLGDDVNFKQYNHDDFNLAKKTCIDDLKKSKVDICVNFKPIYNNNGILESASINYYIDNTRPQFSEILVNAFDRRLDKKMAEISEKTVEDIFSEIKETVVFMRESKDLLDKIQTDLKEAKSLLNIMDLQFKNLEKEYKLQKNQLLNLKNNLEDNLETLSNTQKNFNSDLDSLNSHIASSRNSLNDANDGLDELLSQINYYFAINPQAQDYIDTDNLIKAISNLEDLDSQLYDFNNKIINTRNKINNNGINTNKIKNDLNNMFELLDGIGDYFNVANTKMNSVMSQLDEKEKELDKVNKKINDKLNYFEELSNKDASSITEPISKNKENVLINFQRVHQLAPTIVVMVILFVGLLLSNIIVSLEIGSNAYFRNLISPVSQNKFTLSLFLTSFTIIFIQILFLFFILNSYFGINIFSTSKILMVLLVIIHLIIIFILLGMFFAFIFNNLQVSILVTTFTMLFFFLLSDIIIPLQLMPHSFYLLLQLNPVVMGENLLRMIFPYTNPTLTFLDIFVFYPYIIVLSLMVMWASNYRRKKLF